MSPSAARDSGTAMIRAYQLNLSVLSFASLFVGMFLVYSLVALNAASRRRELAVMRSLGASPRLLFRVFLAEGALLGTAGWLLAIPLSTVMVKYLLPAGLRGIALAAPEVPLAARRKPEILRLQRLAIIRPGHRRRR